MRAASHCVADLMHHIDMLGSTKELGQEDTLEALRELQHRLEDVDLDAIEEALLQRKEERARGTA